MPTPIKILFSLVVLAVAYGGFYFLDSLGHGIVSLLALFLGVFAVISFWIFPEVESNKK